MHIRFEVFGPLVLGAVVALSTACGSNSPAAPKATAEPVVADAGGKASTSAKPYPAGPYGFSVGSTIQNYTFRGWFAPSDVAYDTGALEQVELADFYDPDGSKGIKALFINASARWCSACKSEQPKIAAQRVIWEPQGARFLETLFEDDNQADPSPARADDLQIWGKAYKVTWTLVLDPALTLGDFFDTAATPMNMIIDTSSMKILDIVTGVPQDSWWQSTFGQVIQ
jgi:hypothetical protein